LRAGVYKTLANVFISFIGAGILGLPSAFKESGLVLGAVFLVILSVLAFYCIMLLVDCKKLLESKGVVRFITVIELLHAHLLTPRDASIRVSFKI
jgi:proton-coupled amino acid transporter